MGSSHRRALEKDTARCKKCLPRGKLISGGNYIFTRASSIVE